MPDKVLVVDDEPKAVVEMVAFLKRRGVNACGTSDPLAALAAISNDDTLYAVVTDLRMPHFDGFRVLEAANRRRLEGRLGPLVAITGHATEDDERRAMDCGALHFFQKPLDLRRLLEVLKAAHRAETS